MATARITISLSLDAELAEEVRKAADASNQSLSAWLSDAGRRKLRRARTEVALADFEASFGAITEEELRRVRAVWQA
jgi:ATP-dependent 26S proteasome regulatory subunit